MKPQCQPRARRRSFSLLEMLLVLALLAVAVVLVMEGYSRRFRRAPRPPGGMISDALTEGRSDALAQNTTVEVRIYDLPPQPGATRFTARCNSTAQGGRTTPPVASPTLLPAWVVIDATPGAFPLIAANSQIREPDAGDTRLNSQTRVFHFLPDGSTDLNPATNWFMTCARRPNRDPPVSLQLGVHLGRCHHGTPQIYRP